MRNSARPATPNRAATPRTAGPNRPACTCATTAPSPWLRGNDEATRELIQILAACSGQDPESLPMVVQGSVLNAALTAGVEYWAWNESEVAGQPADGAIREALRIVAGALTENVA